MKKKLHSFHIPVMGIGYTIDSPIRVAHLGISSVISTVDDILVERLRKVYSKKFDLGFDEISNKVDDFRAKRFTAYLDMMQDIASTKFENLKQSFQDKATGELDKLMKILPDTSNVKEGFNKLVEKAPTKDEVYNWLDKNLTMGDIDINIMTKVDRDVYRSGEKLPVEYNDAHAALRGFANSKLNASVVLSAGMNPRLYAYLEKLDQFFPTEKLELEKRIILKVSDYRSALIQGKYLAKRGIWISEYRIESGLNCGGHAFASDGTLIGPIMEEFNKNRDSLVEEIHGLYVVALEQKGKNIPTKPFGIEVTAQGGVGTSKEHNFLMDHYKVDSVGWGTPFLLVPEAISIDGETLNKLSDAKEDDLYLSDISPLGVPFNSLRGNTKDQEKEDRIAAGKPGSPCPKHFVDLNTEFGDKAICVASRNYQTKKIAQLNEQDLSALEYKKAHDKITVKSCICVGLSTGTLKEFNLDHKIEGDGVSVCPGPNMAYYEKERTLVEMAGHINGKTNIMTREDRPNMFVKELRLYIDYFKNQLEDLTETSEKKEVMTLKKMQKNMNKGLEYYSTLLESLKDSTFDAKNKMVTDFEDLKQELNEIVVQLPVAELV
ncbi:MAG: hypothetical protein KAG96_05650 [Ichthyobacteriaceae bacterium]|nr:hypothetical protein [Ichthyobacteriaceae bacterium]